MKHLLLLLLLVSGVSAYTFAQTPAAGNAIKDRILGKWAYEGTEEFGVVTPPDSTQKSDWIQFTTDMKYTRVTGGQKESGAYKVTESTRQLFLTNDATKKTEMCRVKSATADNVVLDFQTPDLVHTLYKFKKA